MTNMYGRANQTKYDNNLSHNRQYIRAKYTEKEVSLNAQIMFSTSALSARLV